MVRIHFPPAKSLQTIGSALWELTRARVRAVSGQQKRAVPVWHEESGQRRRGKKSGIEPNRYGDPKSCDGLTGKQGSANEGRGPGTASFAAGLAVAGIPRSTASGRIGSCGPSTGRSELTSSTGARVSGPRRPVSPSQTQHFTAASGI